MAKQRFKAGELPKALDVRGLHKQVREKAGNRVETTWKGKKIILWLVSHPGPGRNWGGLQVRYKREDERYSHRLTQGMRKSAAIRRAEKQLLERHNF